MASNSAPRSAARRFFLRTSLLLGGSLALFGGAVFMQRGLEHGQLTPSGKDVMRALSLAIFDDLLPHDPAARIAALDECVAKLGLMLNGLPKATRLETSILLGALSTVAGRVAVSGMATAWTEANVQQLQGALERLRLSPLRSAQVIYHGLRDIACLSFFSNARNWASIGYPGQNDV